MYSEDANYYLDYVKSTKKILKSLLETIYLINKNFPNINILLKPHPNENVVFWEKVKNKYSNLKIVKGLSVENFLNLSDLNISQNLCTTTFEANLFGIPTIEIQNSFVKKYSTSIHRNLAKYKINKPKDVLTIIRNELMNFKKNNNKKKTNKRTLGYIEKYFYKFDGNRCKEHAEYIHNYLKKNLKEYKKASELFFCEKNKKMYYKLEKKFKNLDKTRKKNFLKNIKIKLKRMILSHNQPSKIDPKQRFDHRYHVKDETYWYKKFAKLNTRNSQV